MKVLFCALLATWLPLSACLWDTDTIREELAGRTEDVKTLVGWFNRYPPEYYQARLDRVATELKATPQKASLYDDAAVACDRLGKPTEAIAWMEKKIAHALPETVNAGEPSTRYKTLANLGTFHAHRWIKETKAKKSPSSADLETAIKLVTLAIEENPNAHFNREKYQLLVLQWLNGEENIFSQLSNHHTRNLDLAEEGYPDLTDGLLGLVRLGAAWESPDLFYFLQNAYFSEEKEHPRLLANLRIAELMAQKREFLSPLLTPLFIDPGEVTYGKTFLSKELVPPTLEFYEKARVATENREKAFTTYLLAQLAKGRHPDTHPDFWDEWREPDFPALPKNSAFRSRISPLEFVPPLLALLITLLLSLVYFAWKRWKATAA